MSTSEPIPLPPLTKVAIIGAGGPSGISALTQLLDKGVRPDQIRAYEARSSAGGVWHYEEDAGIAQTEWRSDGRLVLRTEQERLDPGRNGPTAVYDKLHTNLQHTAMAFRDHPFPADTPPFPSHKQIVQYLQATVKKRNLEPHISFSTLVRAVYFTPGSDDPASKWTVATSKTVDGERVDSSETFSHVVVCNGHYNEPFVPAIPGLQGFSGKVQHSRWWRSAKRIRGQNVLVVGGRASGSDIARETAIDDEERDAAGEIVGRRIYQSVRVNEAQPSSPEDFWDKRKPWSSRIEVVGEVDRIEGENIQLRDGKVLDDVDLIIFGTGYLYSYPFFPSDKAPFDRYPVTDSLSPAESLFPQAGGHTIRNLNHTDTFYAPAPTLAFVGLHYLNSPFPLSETVSRLIAHSFTRQLIPPLKPLLRQTDRPDDRNLGAPQEFINQDNFLEAIGEGGEDNSSHGGWTRYPDELREARIKSLEYRKEVLGY